MKKKINLAIIGGSFDSTIGNVHLKSLLATGNYEIICGFFSRSKFKNYQNSIQYNIKQNKVYNNLSKLILKERNNFDIALVLTPPNTRYEIYKKLIQNNIDIISEKPIEGSFTNAKKTFKLLEGKKNFFVCTYNYLGYPSIMEIKPLIKKKIGKVLNFVMEMPQQAFVYKKSRPKKWRTKDLKIPNLHLDLASHLLSLIIYFFNEYPREIMSFGSNQINPKILDNNFTWLKFKRFVGSLWFSKNSNGERNQISIRIYGTKGSIKWKHSDPENIIFSDNNGNIEIINRLSAKKEFISKDNLYTYSAGHPNGFLDGFVNIYQKIYKLYSKKNKVNTPPYILNLKENLNIISILDTMHHSSKKNIWHKTKIYY